MTVDERIGNNVHDLLWRRHTKQRALYEALGVTRSALAKKMRGQIAWSAADVETAARVLDVEPGRLFLVAGEAGDDLLALQSLLGHASPATTQVYVEVSRERLRRAAEAA